MDSVIHFLIAALVALTLVQASTEADKAHTPAEADAKEEVVDLTKSRFYVPMCQAVSSYDDLLACVSYLDEECNCVDQDAIMVLDYCLKEFGRHGYRGYVEKQMDLENEIDARRVERGEESSRDGYNRAEACLHHIHEEHIHSHPTEPPTET